MKLWVDDVRPAPEGYTWVKSVNEAKNAIKYFICCGFWDDDIDLIDIDHDAGDYSTDGGDYIRFLDWLEMQGYNFPIRLHSMNPVGVQNMRTIIQRNNWKEVF